MGARQGPGRACIRSSARFTLLPLAASLSKQTPYLDARADLTECRAGRLDPEVAACLDLSRLRFSRRTRKPSLSASRASQDAIVEG